MSKSILSKNLWKPSSAKLDGPSKLSNRLTKPKSFAALPPETPAEANFIRNKGPVDSESWKKSFPPKPDVSTPSTSPKKLPANPLSSMVPSDVPGHPVLPSGKPNQVFYANQSDQLKQVMAAAPKSSTMREGPFSAIDLAKLKQANPLAHDRFAALPPKQQKGVKSFGPMNDMTMMIPKSANAKKSKTPSRFMPWADPNAFEEIYSAKQPSSGNPKAIGTRQAGDNWYLFGTEVGEGIQKPDFAGKDTFGRGDEAATWFAPESFADGSLVGGKPGPNMGTKQVIDDVQGIMEGPWKDYLQSPSMGDAEHGVQAVHGSPDGNDFQTFMGQFDKAKGILESLQSAAKAIRALASFAGMAESYAALGSLADFAIPSSPGELVTSLLKGSGLLGPPAPKKNTKATVAAGLDGIVVTKGGAGAEAEGNALMAQIGKNSSGKGSQGKGTGSDKSVSKETPSPAVSQNGKDSESTLEETRELTAKEKEKVEQAIDNIKNSDFGTSDEGKKVIAVLEEKFNKDNDVNEIKRVNDVAGGGHYHPTGNHGNETGKDHEHEIHVEDGYLKSENPHDLASHLIHEATHAVDDSEFPSPRNSIENEVRAYENAALYRGEFERKHSSVEDYYTSANREEFETKVRKYGAEERNGDGLYADNTNGRYSDIPPEIPKPPDPNHIKYDYGTIGENLRRMDEETYADRLSNYPEDLRLYKNRPRELAFERERERLFQENLQSFIKKGYEPEPI